MLFQPNYCPKKKKYENLPNNMKTNDGFVVNK